MRQKKKQRIEIQITRQHNRPTGAATLEMDVPAGRVATKAPWRAVLVEEAERVLPISAAVKPLVALTV